jgi:ubiquinone/menaquinone biosynthesis C-methylase UbiE
MSTAKPSQNATFSPNHTNYQELVNHKFGTSRTHWKEVYETWGISPTLYRLRQEVCLSLFASLNLPRQSRILEIGSGAGLTAVELALNQYLVDATDSTPEMIDLIRQHASENNVEDRIHARQEDVHQLTFPDQHFDLALGMGVAPWLHSLDRAMQELARVVMPGGYVILSTDNRWSLKMILDPFSFPLFHRLRRTLRLILERIALLPPSVRPRFYTIKEFDGFLSRAGFEKLKGVTVGFGPFTFFARKILPDSIAIKTHMFFQRLADQGLQPLQSFGLEYIVLARRR